jgi:RNA polymerase sigma-70 factor (ECF subfamily)
MEPGPLLTRLRGGDLDAIQAVLDEFGGMLLAYLARMVNDRWAADDLLQDVMVKLIRNAGSIRDEKSLKTWLYSVARNEAVTYLRKHRAEKRNLPEPAVGPESPMEDADRRERIEAVQRAIDALEEPFRTAFVLCEMQGMDHESAARIMECSVKTVSTRLYRAWEKFRTLMRPYLSGTGV